MKTQSHFPKIPLLLSAIFFVVSLLVFIFFLKAINHHSEDLQVKEEEWQKETLRRDGIKALDHSVKVIASERAELGTHFAESADIVPFLDTIEGLGPKVGVKAEVTSVSILEDGTGLLVGLNASGTFSGFYKFLTLLENSPYELEFMSMDMHKEGATESVKGKVVAGGWVVILKIKLLSFMK